MSQDEPFLRIVLMMTLLNPRRGHKRQGCRHLIFYSRANSRFQTQSRCTSMQLTRLSQSCRLSPPSKKAGTRAVETIQWKCWDPERTSPPHIQFLLFESEDRDQFKGLQAPKNPNDPRVPLCCCCLLWSQCFIAALWIEVSSKHTSLSAGNPLCDRATLWLVLMRAQGRIIYRSGYAQGEDQPQ